MSRNRRKRQKHVVIEQPRQRLTRRERLLAAHNSIDADKWSIAPGVYEDWQFEFSDDRFAWTDRSQPLGWWLGLALVLGVTIAATILPILFVFLCVSAISAVGLIWDLLFTEGFLIQDFLAWAGHATVSFWTSTEAWAVALLCGATIFAIGIFGAATQSVIRFEFDNASRTLSISTHRALFNRTRAETVPFESIVTVTPYEDRDRAYFVVSFVRGNGATNTRQLGGYIPLKHCLAHIDWLRPTLGDKLQPMCKHES